MFFGGYPARKKILKIFHTFCRRGGGSDLVWKIPHFFFEGFPKTSRYFIELLFGISEESEVWNISGVIFIPLSKAL